jgi:hypothetical protein
MSVAEIRQYVRDVLTQQVLDDLETRANRTGFQPAMLGAIIVDAAGISVSTTMNAVVTGDVLAGALEAFNTDLETALLKFLRQCPKLKQVVKQPGKPQ